VEIQEILDLVETQEIQEILVDRAVPILEEQDLQQIRLIWHL